MNLAHKIKKLRTKNGFSQEMLAENSGLSLRTIQRIEKETSVPTADSIKKLAAGLNITPDELIDWEITKNPGYLKSLNLSALTFLFFPLLGILVPSLIWFIKKDKITDLNTTGKALVNFQITWNIVFFLILILMFISSKTKFLLFGVGPITLFIGIMYLFNFISIIINSSRVMKGKKVSYKLKINFLN
ncbi:DNA-binding protein [Tenacibaculum sp. E3R01]|uniref:helix-turn-helix domain-containing protein n=1 Tax=Tenacibaculum sp. E3R01 TaxID=2267227 RepID=UPI000DEB050A|nr:helix-turn-helix domain-containing protein [Tenacibaculum sp. E3R01]RBW56495.1 DNA-binding protein [Tenacibaculum sp. E3R01]